MKYFSISSNKRELRGMIHEGTSKVKAVVLIIHGYFSSNKIGPNRLYFRIAEELKGDGFTVVRCDLSAMGESEGKIHEITFNDQVLDVQNLVFFLKREYCRKITLISHSIGCLLAIENIITLPDCFERGVLISPIYSTNQILNRLFDDKMVLELKDKGYTYRKGVYVDNSFFNESVTLRHVSQKIRKIKIPINILGGTDDQFVEPQELGELCVNSNITPIIISNGDHNFLDIESRDVLINEIRKFLKP